MYDFVRVAVCVPKTAVGNVKKNTKDIIEKITQAQNKNCDFAIFPELSLTGHSAGDLFFWEDAIKNVKCSINEIAEFTENKKTVVVFGAPLEIDGTLLNCALVVSDGRICGIVPKSTIGAYGNTFDTKYFTSAENMGRTEITSEEIGVFPTYPIPVGTDIIFSGREGVRFCVEIGEDLFLPVSMAKKLCISGAEMVINIAGFAAMARLSENVKTMALANSLGLESVYVVSSSGSDESTTDVVYSGKGLVCQKGKVLAENKNVTDSDYVEITDVDFGKIRADRKRNKLFGIKEKDIRKTTLYRGKTDNTLLSDGTLLKIKKLPFVPEDISDREKRCKEIFEIQSSGLLKRMSVAGKKVVIGVSGGLDSTLALLVCVNTVKKAGLPFQNVIGVTLPCFGTTKRTYDNAFSLMEKLGITHINIDIKDACIKHFEDIGHDVNVTDVTYENAQARERTQVLMDIANKNGAIVCGTGDLSELVLGWCTYNADHMSMYGVNSGIPKTLIKYMIEYLANTEDFEDCKEVLLDIADTPISPELLPPDKSGNIAQKTEESVGPYVLNDFFLYYTLRYGFSREKIKHLAKKAFDGEYGQEAIEKHLEIFYKRFFTQQFKRSCLPDGVKTGVVGVSPRTDLHLPSDVSVW